MISDFNKWKEELLFTGRIIQLNDQSVSAEEAHRRALRFMEMVDSLSGNEGPAVVDALYESIQVNYSHGAYNSIDHALARFPEREYLNALVKALPRLIKELPDRAGEQLVSIANGIGGKWEYQISIFNQMVLEAPEDTISIITSYIRNQESKGWLEHRVGVLCPF